MRNYKLSTQNAYAYYKKDDKNFPSFRVKNPYIRTRTLYVKTNGRDKKYMNELNHASEW